MSSRMIKSLIATSAIGLLVIAVVYAQNKSTNVTPPSQEKPLDTISKLSSQAKATSPAQSARTRCLAKQQARLDSCASKTGQERAVCEAVAKELIAVCNQIDPDASGFLASSLFCNGKCDVRECPPGGCPLPAGGTCLGNVCVNEGKLCDPDGILIDFHCTTSVVTAPIEPHPKLCSCSCQ